MPLDPIPPGEILKEEFMVPHGLSANRLAAALGVPANRVSGIVNGSRAITPDSALRLGRYFRTTPEFWLNLQSRYDLERAKDEARRRGSHLNAELARIGTVGR